MLVCHPLFIKLLRSTWLASTASAVTMDTLSFLQYIRELSRQQFMARATILKARSSAGLPDHGTWPSHTHLKPHKLQGLYQFICHLDCQCIGFAVSTFKTKFYCTFYLSIYPSFCCCDIIAQFYHTCNHTCMPDMRSYFQGMGMVAEPRTVCREPGTSIGKSRKTN